MAANLRRHVSQSKYLFNIILLLLNDIHLNPGPSDTGHPSPITFNTKCLKVAHLNVCSLLGKVDELRMLMTHTPFDMLTLSETWLSKDVLDCEISLPGYSSVQKDQTIQCGGGVITYIKHGLIFSECEDLNNDIDKVLWIEINRNNCEAVLMENTYCALDCALDDLLHRMEQSLLQVESKHYEKVVLGDFNVNFNFSN